MRPTPLAHPLGLDCQEVRSGRGSSPTPAPLGRRGGSDVPLGLRGGQRGPGPYAAGVAEGHNGGDSHSASVFLDLCREVGSADVVVGRPSSPLNMAGVSSALCGPRSGLRSPRNASLGLDRPLAPEALDLSTLVVTTSLHVSHKHPLSPNTTKCIDMPPGSLHRSWFSLRPTAYFSDDICRDA